MARRSGGGPPKRERPALAGTGALENTPNNTARDNRDGHSSQGGSERRPSKAAIEAAIRRAGDGCTICRKPLAAGAARASGYVDGNPQLELAGLCCSDKLSVVWGFDLAPDLRPEAPHVRDDRQWFAAHPRRTHRIRPAYPAEQRSEHGGKPATHVVVRQVRPGARLRIGFAPPEPLPDVEELGHAAFDVLSECNATGRRIVPIAKFYERASAMAAQGGNA